MYFPIDTFNSYFTHFFTGSEKELRLLHKASKKCIQKKVYKNFDSNIKEILLEIRYALTFTDSPSKDEFINGTVDCVGAAIWFKLLIQKKFKITLSLVSVPIMPYSLNRCDSKHVCLVEKRQNKIRLIDPTPINGYGYGRTSEWFSDNEIDITTFSLKSKNYLFW